MAEGPGAGMTRAFRLYELPMRAMLTKVVHGYHYNASVPVIAPPEEMEELGRPRGGQAAARHPAPARAVGARVAAGDPRPHRRARGGRPADRLARRAGRRPRGRPRAARPPVGPPHGDRAPGLHGGQRVRRVLPRPLRRRGLDAYRLLQGLDNKTVEVGATCGGSAASRCARPRSSTSSSARRPPTCRRCLEATRRARAFLAELESTSPPTAPLRDTGG